jgi:translocation and assembly module TamB
MTSEPSLSQEDIVLLLAVGMTRAELDQLQASSIGASIALNYLGRERRRPRGQAGAADHR